MSPRKVAVFVAAIIFVFSSVRVSAQNGVTDKQLIDGLIDKALYLFSSQDARRAEAEARIYVTAKGQSNTIYCEFRGRAQFEGNNLKLELVDTEPGSNGLCYLRWLLRNSLNKELQKNTATLLRELLAKYQVAVVAKEEGGFRTLYRLRATTDPKDHIPQIDLGIIAETGEVPYLITYNQYSQSEPFRWEQKYAYQADGRFVLKSMRWTTAFDYSIPLIISKPAVVAEIVISLPIRFSN